VKPFLLLATRAEDVAADAEYRSFLRFGGLAEDELRRVRLEADPMPE
jgi:GMP synthase (glutamine-hydrolysing)